MSFSAPGAAMNGNRFFVIRNNNELIEHTPKGVWEPRGYLPGSWRMLLLRSPRSPVPGVRLFTVVYREYYNRSELLEYDLITWQWRFHGPPPNTSCGSASSEVMYGNRVYLIGEDNTLRECKFWVGGSSWYNFGKPHGHNLTTTPPCVLSDGKLFFTNSYGHLIQMWWKQATSEWHYHNHGIPANKIKAISVGAPMPMSNKVFVTCNDGSLRQLWWNASQQRWNWHNHGKPPGGYADTVPVTISDGKLHINCSPNPNSTTTQKCLYELYWNGYQWIWYNHEHPPGVQLVSGATADMVGGISYVLGKNNTYYERRWDSAANTWIWVSHGAP